jgi:nitric oxide reductase large subunit
MASAAIVGVFTLIPIISEYAFWVVVAAYFIWLAVHRLHHGFKPLLMVSIVLLLLAIVGSSSKSHLSAITSFGLWKPTIS